MCVIRNYTSGTTLLAYKVPDECIIRPSLVMHAHPGDDSGIGPVVVEVAVIACYHKATIDPGARFSDPSGDHDFLHLTRVVDDWPLTQQHLLIHLAGCHRQHSSRRPGIKST